MANRADQLYGKNQKLLFEMLRSANGLKLSVPSSQHSNLLGLLTNLSLKT
jgi:hypothetical protein